MEMKASRENNKFNKLDSINSNLMVLSNLNITISTAQDKSKKGKLEK